MAARPLIRWLGEIALADTGQVGAKAAQLAECRRAGFAVPDGFVLTVEAHRRSGGELTAELAAAAAAGDPAARDRALDLDLAPEVEQALLDSYGRLGKPAVAVRVSVPAEQQVDPWAVPGWERAAFLGVRDENYLLDTVVMCWAWLWSTRAVEHRRAAGQAHWGGAIAVLIQEMADADTSGTAVWEQPDSLLVHACPGLGESLVAGEVDPDRIVLDRATRQVQRWHLGGKHHRRDLAPGGGLLRTEVSDDARAAPCLGRGQLSRLVDLAENVEAVLGCSPHLEWAFTGDDLVLLQARPGPGATPAGPPGLRRSEQAERAELVSRHPAPHPLDAPLVRGVYARAAESDTEPAEVIRADEDGIIRIVLNHKPVTVAALSKLRNLRPRGGQENRAQPTQVSWVTTAEQARTLNPTHLLQALEQESAALAEVAAAALKDIAGGVTEGLMSMAASASQVRVDDLLIGPAELTLHTDFARLVEAARQPDALEILGGADTAGRRAALLAEDGGPFREHLQEFLRVHGARTPRDLLALSTRSWGEDPEPLVTMVAAAVRAPQLRQLQAVPAASLVEERLPGPIRGRWREAVTQLQAATAERVRLRAQVAEGGVLLRIVVDEVASRLVGAGAITHPADLRHLYLREIRWALEHPGTPLTDLVERRRRRRAAAESAWWGTRFDPEVEIRGSGTGAGEAVGPARLLLGEADLDRVQPGDVLVCPWFDPAWTPLLSVAGALVCDTGAPLTPVSVAAAAYRVPTVLRTRGVSARIPEGVRVFVDGGTGRVVVTG